MRRTFGILAVGGAALALTGIGAGTAAAENVTGGDPAPFPFESGQATAGAAAESLMMGAEDRPEGADGIEVEPPDLDRRALEGPAGGLLDGPLD